MRRRAFYYLNQQKCDNEIKETFGFKSRKCPAPSSDLIPFEKRFIRHADIIEI